MSRLFRPLNALGGIDVMMFELRKRVASMGKLANESVMDVRLFPARSLPRHHIPCDIRCANERDRLKEREGRERERKKEVNQIVRSCRGQERRRRRTLLNKKTGLSKDGV